MFVHPLFIAAVAPVRSRRRGHIHVIWKFMSKGNRILKSALSEKVSDLRSESSPIIIWKTRDGLTALLMPIW